MQPVGKVLELWRYPVKTMAGERLDAATVDVRGVAGDRAWAVRDEGKGVITNGKALPALMQLAARYVGEPEVAITFPDGGEVRSDDPDVHRRLSDFLGRAVTLCPLRPASDKAHYRAAKSTAAEMRAAFGVGPGEPLPDFSMLPASKLAELARYATPPGTYFDAYTFHLVTTSSLAAIRAASPGSDADARRFRPNLVVDTGDGAELVEVGWCGGALAAGEVVVEVLIPTVRCAMPTRAQPGLGADPTVLRAVAAHANRCLGAYGEVEQGGRVAVGDEVRVAAPRDTTVGRWMKAGATSLKRLALRAAARSLPEK